MIYPSISSYDTSIKNFSQFIVASKFKNGNPIFNNNNLVAYSGGYSVVYPISINNNKLALRCWIKHPGNIKDHYSIVTKYLKTNSSKYIVDFGYIHEGIIVENKIYPISYMDWVEGDTLSQFIEDNINYNNIMNTLAENFLNMVTNLHSLGISHGDLQDGNIIVSKKSTVCNLALVDYDCLYVPQMDIHFDLQGVPSYQHPNRMNNLKEKSDYFSELVIYLSLLAYSEDSNLWELGQEKKLLFTECDLADSLNSKMFKKLRAMSTQIRYLSNILISYCNSIDQRDFLPLDKILSNNSTNHLNDNWSDQFKASFEKTNTTVEQNSNENYFFLKPNKLNKLKSNSQTNNYSDNFLKSFSNLFNTEDLIDKNVKQQASKKVTKKAIPSTINSTANIKTTTASPRKIKNKISIGIILTFIVIILLIYNNIENKPGPLPPQEYIVKVTHVINIRTGPGTQYDIITTCPAGLNFKVKELKSDWYHIDFLLDNIPHSGWISAKYTTKY